LRTLAGDVSGVATGIAEVHFSSPHHFLLAGLPPDRPLCFRFGSSLCTYSRQVRVIGELLVIVLVCLMEVALSEELL
jgi:hypothetical protein